jgi:hypothetical protein
MLDELIGRYGEGAIVSVRPNMDDAGETLRWVVEINGEGDPMSMSLSVGLASGPSRHVVDAARLWR